MSGNIEFKEIQKNRALWLKVGGTEFIALKLEGFKATQLGGTVSPIGVGVGRARAEGDDWLLIVKDKNGIVPYEVWARRAAQAITNVTGSNIGTVSIVSSESTTPGPVIYADKCPFCGTLVGFPIEKCPSCGKDLRGR